MKETLNIYTMQLHETIEAEMKWGVRYDITRVAGGWIYQPIYRHRDGKDEIAAPAFVPYNNDCQPQIY